MGERLPVGGGLLSVRPIVATGAYYTTQGFSKAASSAVNGFEVALNTCQHVPAIGKTRERKRRAEK